MDKRKPPGRLVGHLRGSLGWGVAGGSLPSVYGIFRAGTLGDLLLVGNLYSWCIAVPFGRNRFAGQARGDGASSWCRTFMPNGKRSSWCLPFMQGTSRGRLRGKRPPFLVADFYAGPGLPPSLELLPPVHRGAVRHEPLFTVGQGQTLPSMWPPFMRNGDRIHLMGNLYAALGLTGRCPLSA